MMSVLNDYKCPVHGYFEAYEAVCPAGCTDVSVVFLKPIGVKSDSTKHNDRTLNQLALDFKMGDIKSSDIGGYNLNSINGEAVSGMQAVKQSGANLAGPKVGSYIADHENLKIQK
jgi:hypothetical protein